MLGSVIFTENTQKKCKERGNNSGALTTLYVIVSKQIIMFLTK